MPTSVLSDTINGTYQDLIFSDIPDSQIVKNNRYKWKNYSQSITDPGISEGIRNKKVKKTQKTNHQQDGKNKHPDLENSFLIDKKGKHM
jgi:hypothetical protein